MNILKKNEILECKIERIGFNGEGIAVKNNFVIFIKKTLIDEIVKIKIIKVTSKFAIGKLLEIIKPSKYRTKLICDSPLCGGCQLNFVDYNFQLKIKNKIISDFFRNNIPNKIININNIIESPKLNAYRNKVILPISKEKDEIKIGFYAPKSHRIINIKNCFVQNNIFEKITLFIKSFIEKNNISVYDEFKHKGLLRNIMFKINNDASEIMLTLIINGDKINNSDLLINSLIKNFKEIVSIYLCKNKNKTNVILNDNLTLLYGKKYLMVKLNEYNYYIKPNTFFQINYEQTKNMYDFIKKLVNKIKPEIVFDLYSGVSSIGIYIAELVNKIYSIEINKISSNLAKKNTKLNNINNIKNISGNSLSIIKNLFTQNKIPDLIILDPPRKGCEKEELQLIIKKQIQNIIYVSCNPATLSRDCNYFIKNNYSIDIIQPFDMFPFTFHIETILVLQKNK